ncbi:MAG TPA: hypothetical protein VF183_12110 [Acidimicrobiales bacterium]
MAHELRFTKPLYTVKTAAQLVGMPPTTLTAWARGYERRFPGRPPVTQGPVITSVAPSPGSWETIPFIGLVEAMVVQAFRRTGLPLQRIRRALAVLAEQQELEHALASRRLYTDGAQILYDYSKETDDPQLRLLTVVASGQRVFHEVIAEYLTRIEFDDDDWATEVVLPVTERRLLRIRPDVASGEPIFIHGGAPLSAVRSRFLAGEEIASIARDYGVPPTDITEALHALSTQRRAA